LWQCVPDFISVRIRSRRGADLYLALLYSIADDVAYLYGVSFDWRRHQRLVNSSNGLTEVLVHTPKIVPNDQPRSAEVLRFPEHPGNSGRESVARSTMNTPSLKRSATFATVWTASLVFPIPPGPTIVNSRVRSRRCPSSACSCCRPTKLVKFARTATGPARETPCTAASHHTSHAPEVL
jgi:hypothetical protein